MEISLTEITAFFFLVFSTLVLIKILFWGDGEDKRLQKIFGGVIVLVVALVSKDNTVVVISLFIGGLIVASEDFMKFLAAVIRTRGDKVAETISAFVSKASDQELASNRESEVIEAKAAEIITEEETASFTKKDKLAFGKNHKVSYSSLLPKLELGTLRYVFRYMDGFEKLEENVRLGSYVFDGFTISKHGRPYFLEVKVFPNITTRDGKILVHQVTTRLNLWLPKIISAFDSLQITNNREKPVLIVNLALNALGDLSSVKEAVKRMNIQQLSDYVLVKFQYLNLPELMAKGAFVSLVDSKELPQSYSARDGQPE